MTDYNMVDVSAKKTTHRVAVAQGRIEVGAEAFTMIRNRKLPKGDPIALAEVAGIQGAKRAHENIPLCHPLALDQVKLGWEFDESAHSIWVTCKASATAKTGVEMEALAGVQAALLAVYDLTKQVTPVLKISDIRLNTKTGGKSGNWQHPEFSGAVKTLKPDKKLAGVQTAVVTLSDRAAEGVYEDRSGPLLVERLEAVGAKLLEKTILPDDPAKIEASLRRLTETANLSLIVTTGGTGIGPRDHTPEIIEKLCDRLIPGLAEKMRTQSALQTPFAHLSRAVAGVRNSTLIIALPGNPKAVTENLDAIVDIIPHALDMIQGKGH